MIDFASFETFDPSGPGLGNLFNPISPLEALGIWPSGDFRLDPGDGAMPAIGYYLGGALGLVALAYGLVWWLRRGERAVPAALAVAAALFAYAHFSGHAVPGGEVDRDRLAAGDADRRPGAAQRRAPRASSAVSGARSPGGEAARSGRAARHHSVIAAALAVAFCGAAVGCSLVALVNGPVGPAAYSPDLTELRPRLGHRLDPRPCPGAPARRRARTRLPRLGAAGRAGVRGSRRPALHRPAATGNLAGDRPESVDDSAIRGAAARAPGRAVHAVAPPLPSAGPRPVSVDLGGTSAPIWVRTAALPGNNGSSGPHAGGVEHSGARPRSQGWL